jgi:hypothetical protein
MRSYSSSEISPATPPTSAPLTRVARSARPRQGHDGEPDAPRPAIPPPLFAQPPSGHVTAAANALINASSPTVSYSLLCAELPSATER